VDKTAHRVIIDGKDVDLSYKEFELLTYFMENKVISAGCQHNNRNLGVHTDLPAYLPTIHFWHHDIQSGISW